MTTDRSGTTLLDVNVLLALVWDQHVHHGRAHACFPDVADDFATAPMTESGLVRLLLTPAITGRAVTAGEALTALRGIRSLPGWRFLADDASLATTSVDTAILVGRRQVTGLHLVALCAAHGCGLATFDAGLRRGLAPADRDTVVVWS